jgi:hypothetical protein
MSIKARIMKFGAKQMLLKNIAEHKTPDTTKKCFLSNLSPRKPNTGCKIEPNTANTVGSTDTCVIVKWREV